METTQLAPKVINAPLVEIGLQFALINDLGSFIVEAKNKKTLCPHIW